MVVKKIANPFKKFNFGNQIRCASWKYVVNFFFKYDCFSLLPVSKCTFYWRFFFSTCTAKLNFRFMFFCTCTVIVFHTTKKNFLQGYVESWYKFTRLLVRSTWVVEILLLFVLTILSTRQVILRTLEGHHFDHPCSLVITVLVFLWD